MSSEVRDMQSVIYGLDHQFENRRKMSYDSPFVDSNQESEKDISEILTLERWTDINCKKDLDFKVFNESNYSSQLNQESNTVISYEVPLMQFEGHCKETQIMNEEQTLQEEPNHQVSLERDPNAMDEEDIVFVPDNSEQHIESSDSARHRFDSEETMSFLSEKSASKRTKVSKRIGKTKNKIATPAKVAKAKKQAQKKTAISVNNPPNSKKLDVKQISEYVSVICWKIFLQQDLPGLKAAIIAVNKDPEVRGLVLSLIPLDEKRSLSAEERYSENPSEKTFEEIIRAQIINPHRKDELQKKTLSKITHLIYKKTYKFKSKIPKTVAQARMKADFDLDGDQPRDGFESTKNEIFERLFGSDRKMGMHNDVVREILLNKTLFDLMLNYEFLCNVLLELDEQTKSDIKTNIVSKFETCTIDELKASAFTQDGKKKQSFKLPWSRLHNVEALLTFLDKLYYRSNKEKFDSQTNHLRNLITEFSRTYDDLKATHAN